MANKSVFLDVDSSIVENNLRFTTDTKEEEFNKLFGPQEVVYPSKLVKPFPGFCVKTKLIGCQTKFFLNVCYTDAIPCPKDITEKELYDTLQSDESVDFRVPMSIGEIRECTDKNGSLAKCCDVAIHPDFFKKVQRIQLFKNFLMTVIFEGLKEKYGIVCNDEKIILKNKQAFGTIQMHRIQQRDIAEKMGLDYKDIMKESVQKTPTIEILQSTENKEIENIKKIEEETSQIQENKGTEIKTKQPEYRLYRKKDEPNILIGEFAFPDIQSSKDLVVDIGEDRILIQAASKNYLLDIFTPIFIRQSKASTTFNKATKILTITMPIIGG